MRSGLVMAAVSTTAKEHILNFWAIARIAEQKQHLGDTLAKGGFG
jgi:hypothetical protein